MKKLLVFLGILGLTVVAVGAIAAANTSRTSLLPCEGDLDTNGCTASFGYDCPDHGTDPYPRCNVALERVPDESRTGVSYTGEVSAEACFRPSECTGVSRGIGRSGAEVADQHLVDIIDVGDFVLVQECQVQVGQICSPELGAPGRHVFIGADESEPDEADAWADGTNVRIDTPQMCASTSLSTPCGAGGQASVEDSSPDSWVGVG